MTVELWKQFSLGEGNTPDVGGGIMYALKYSSEIIEQKAQQVATVLDGIEGLSISEVEQDLHVDASAVQEESIARVSALIEEQSILTDAMVYREFFDKIGVSSIAGVTQHVLTLFAHLDNQNKVDLYNEVDMFIGGIIREIMIADRQNNILSAKQKKELKELAEARKRFLKVAGGRYVIVG